MATDIESLRFKAKTKFCLADYALPLIVIGALLVFALGLGLGMKIGHATAMKQNASQHAH